MDESCNGDAAHKQIHCRFCCRAGEVLYLAEEVAVVVFQGETVLFTQAEGL